MTIVCGLEWRCGCRLALLLLWSGPSRSSVHLTFSMLVCLFLRLLLLPLAVSFLLPLLVFPLSVPRRSAYALMPEGHKRGKKEELQEAQEEEAKRVALLTPEQLAAEGEEESASVRDAREALEAARQKEREGKPGFLTSLLSRFFGKKSRAPPSAADPSALCGVQIDNEDDVLHVKRLPDFGGRISQRNSELLVSYLTAPYLRIPLTLAFFAHQERLNSLGSEKLRALMDGILFEPGVK